MDRRRFLTASAGVVVVGVGGQLNSPLVTALSQLGERLGTLPGQVPDSHIGAPEVARIREMADLIERRAHVIGGGAETSKGDEFDNAMLSVRTVQAALAADHSGTVDRDLYIAAGWLFRAVGFMAFDTNRLTIAQDLLRAAHECAAHAGCASLEARTLGTLARQEAWKGDAATAAQYAARALRLDGLTSRERAMLHAVQARALARLGMVQPTLRAVGESDADMMHLAPGDTADRPWVGFFDFAHQQGDTGRALLDLALTMDPADSAGVLADGASRHRASLDAFDVNTHRRSAAFTYLNLAATEVLAGTPEMALRTGGSAIGLGAGIRSQRLDEHLRMLDGVCRQHAPGNASAAELREAVAGALVAGEQP